MTRNSSSRSASDDERPRTRPELGETVATRVAAVARMQRTLFDRRARSLGVTRAQWLVLNRVPRDGITQGELAALMEVEPITAARLVDSLEEIGWVERRTLRSDRRKRLVTLTDKVLPLMERINEVGAATEEDVMTCLDEAERDRLMEMLGKLQDRLRALLQVDVGTGSGKG